MPIVKFTKKNISKISKFHVFYDYHMYLACVLARALKFGGVHGYVYFLFFKQKVHIPFIFNFKSVLRHRPCITCKNNTSDPLPLLARGRAGECRAVKPTERRAIAKCLKKCVITQGILLQISLGLLHMRKKGAVAAPSHHAMHISDCESALSA